MFLKCLKMQGNGKFPKFWLCVMCVSIYCGTVLCAKIRCPRPDAIQNGSYRIRKSSIMRINCRYGYNLIGSRIIECVRGKWYGERPVCARKGCSQSLSKPEFGFIEYKNEVATLFCQDNYIRAGSMSAYCNGTHWDRSIGSCRQRREETQHQCDFETDDLCGWSMSDSAYAWKRVMASDIFTSFNTGPRHDHTTNLANGGHYMLLGSLGNLQAPIHLMSPIYDKELTLKTACCFRFFYFMYGADVGELYVFVRPITVSISDVWAKKELYQKFYLKGNQNNMWNKGQFNIEELTSNFQIIFSVFGGRGHLSDIAIDDVKVMTGKECSDDPDAIEDSDEMTERALFDVQSCVSRCDEESGTGVVMKDGKLTGLCNCHEECEVSGTCCPDYRLVCLSVIYARATTYSTTGYELEDTTNMNDANEVTTLLETTAATTTTTSKQPETTRSTTAATTTTTRKPTTTTTATTTSTTTTTTSTTPKPTTTTTTTTTTKTTTTPKPTTTTTTIRPSTTTTLRTTTTKRTTAATTTKRTTPRTTTTTTQRTTTTTLKPANKIATVTVSTTTTSEKQETTRTNEIKPTSTTTVAPAHTTARVQNKTIWIVAANETSAFNPPHHGVNVLLYLLLTALLVICCVTLTKRYKDSLKTWYLQRNGSTDDPSYVGSTHSILAKFIPRNGQAGAEHRNGNYNTKSKRKSRECSDDKASLISDDDCDYDGNLIVLSDKPSTNL